MRIYKAQYYNGKSIGEGFLHRRGVQIVCEDHETGKRRFIPGRNSPCLKLGWRAYHYKSGFNKSDAREIDALMAKATAMASEFNLDPTMA